MNDQKSTALHQQIMNLPARIPDAVFTHDRNNGASAYQRGFSDARQAAAELVATHGVTPCAGSCCDCGKGCTAPGVRAVDGGQQ